MLLVGFECHWHSSLVLYDCSVRMGGGPGMDQDRIIL